ncbi:unnamed protein product, partial [Brassica oleracea]
TLPGLTRTHISSTRLYATSIGCSSMHSTHGSKLVMSPRKTCDCSARLSAPTPPWSVAPSKHRHLCYLWDCQLLRE